LNEWIESIRKKIVEEIDEAIKNRINSVLNSGEEEQPKSYKEFMKECLKKYGGGVSAMKICVELWRQKKGKHTEGKKSKSTEITPGTYIILGNDNEVSLLLKEVFADEIEKGIFRYIKANTKKGEELMELFGVRESELPIVAYRDKDCFKLCTIEVNDNGEIIVETIG